MLRDRKDYPKLFTPKGPAIWPALNEPDYKFKKDTGEWHARIRIPADEVDQWQPVIDAAQEILDEAFADKKDELTKAKKGALLKELNVNDVFLKPEVNSETGEETGFYIFRAALGYRVEIKNGPKAGEVFYKRPDMFNAQGKPLKNPPKIGGGSVLKLNVTPMEYFMPKDKTIGIRFELNAVQVITAKAGEARSASDYGFGAEEGDDIQDGEPNTGGFADESGGTDNDDF